MKMDGSTTFANAIHDRKHIHDDMGCTICDISGTGVGKASNWGQADAMKAEKQLKTFGNVKGCHAETCHNDGA